MFFAKNCTFLQSFAKFLQMFANILHIFEDLDFFCKYFANVLQNFANLVGIKIQVRRELDFEWREIAFREKMW